MLDAADARADGYRPAREPTASPTAKSRLRLRKSRLAKLAPCRFGARQGLAWRGERGAGIQGGSGVLAVGPPPRFAPRGHDASGPRQHRCRGHRGPLCRGGGCHCALCAGPRHPFVLPGTARSGPAARPAPATSPPAPSPPGVQGPRAGPGRRAGWRVPAVPDGCRPRAGTRKGPGPPLRAGRKQDTARVLPRSGPSAVSAKLQLAGGGAEGAWAGDRVPGGGTEAGWHPARSPLTPRPVSRQRFASVPRYVETLVVADESMARFHGAGLTRYLLTVMAAAAKAFRHASLANPVELLVTRLVVLGEDTPGPPVTSNAAQMLRNFCEWQKDLNDPDEDSPRHFDTAILFTRQDLCGAATCNTLGMADVGTVCNPTRSCSIVEDDGLQAAFTAAHELGHVFNMLHDDSKPCEELNGRSRALRHMMAPVMSSVDPEETWSPCSARFITDFLDNGHGHCLLDKPPEWLPLPSALPGSEYDADRQCQLTFGPESRHCPGPQPPCASLWCTGHANGRSLCQTKHFPWADGTPCAPGKTCMNGLCISHGDMKAFDTPVDGGWGPWGPWGECSRSCGGGVQFSQRACAKPVPRNGGKYCEGKRAQFRSCNVDACPALTFREQQCAAYNYRSDLFKGFPAPMDWVPRYSGVAERDQCKLTCQSEALGYYHVLEPRVADGTPCSPESTSVCVQGRCIAAGCDRVIGSKKKFDKCMTCGGDGSGCTKIYGSFAKARYGYNDVVTIPAGATHILVRQISAAGGDDVFLALRRPDGTSLLNGNYVLVPSETDVKLAGGATLRYSGATKTTEMLAGRGPLQEPLVLQALVVNEQRPPRLKYSFFVPRAKKRPCHGGWCHPAEPGTYQGQWWSMRRTQRWQTRQWWARGGR
uniref:A disintegrin and metalloproteinase with thrombospondin motifs 4 n=1 Tax=Dromaius novaehollandiae TaxID=8790 RepID=A0A8C4JSU5_DRONO